MDKLYFIICVSMMFTCVCYIYYIYSTCELMCMSECKHVREQVFIYTRMFLFSGFTHPFFIQEGKCHPLISRPKAEFSIWRSLRSQCIKLSCSNCCLLQFIFVLSFSWQNVKSFSFHCLQLSASAGFWYAVPASLREKSSKDHDEACKPENCRHWGNFSI